jgi:CheY-like chemotaxis protein
MTSSPRPEGREHELAHAELRELSAARTVLVVDDEAGVRQLLAVILEMEGHRVLQAASGADALAQVESEPVDLITLDVMMPGLDGWAVAEQLDADPRTAGIPRIMISGKPLDELRAAPGARRAAAVLTKPFDFAELSALVAELLAPRLPTVPAPRPAREHVHDRRVLRKS